MTRLLYITNGINGSGGLERVLSVKTAYLAEKLGYEIHLMTLNKGHEKPFYGFSDAICWYDITVSGNAFSYMNRYLSGIRAIIKKVRPTVIIVCDDGLKAFFLPLFLGAAVPIVYERHVSKNIEIGKGFSTWKLLLAKLKMKTMDVLAGGFARFVVLTKGNAKEWHTRNLQVIPNPLPFYLPQSASLENKKVIAVGKQSYQKGYDRLLQSWQIVQAQHPGWQLEIYGKSDPAQGLEALADSLGIAGTVHFFEPDAHIAEKYLGASLYVLSSRFEGFGMVLIEAMSCGLPCVAFDCPFGPGDIIMDGDDGFLVPNGDIHALAAKLSALMGNEPLRKQMGAVAKQNVRRYLPDEVMWQWDELFKSLRR